ncbi:cell division protease FtsH [Natranaerovirga hydrolytica]|uniref:ATP-dependent zinc metalloprotease FtsH n=1 Tax=Natranaerovirga hydrolytica TaxID=680378 RepID=A0A4R1N104_9FIRM|nr:ATP-dependent metallopeptidase FtsH/Yme1/Tma family protein [Natranaerovirga hydrolytica]TCK98620.1 cell division protease FtsH [Natranaerovirga hydrolytica]
MKKEYIAIVAIIIIAGIGLIGNYFLDNSIDTMTYNTFLTAIDEGNVKEVVLEEGSTSFVVTLNNEATYEVPHPRTDDFISFLLLEDIEVHYATGNGITRNLQVLLVLSIAGGIFYYSRYGGKDKKLIKDTNKNNDQSNILLGQVAGNVEAKAMVEDVINFIKKPEKYTDVGAKMPRGLLLYGPPGTGKTLMAKAIAGEANVPFYAMSGSDFVQMYVGVGANRIRSLFTKAKKSEKAVIFIDEIDAIGKARGRSSSASNDERDQTLNALLTEMSGFNDSNGIIVIGATNRLDTLDEALLRPGRFDRQIEIGLPDVNARQKIIELYANEKPLAEDVCLKSLAKSTVYFSGAMLENLINEAAIFAANDSEKYIRQNHIDKAFYTVIAGAEKKDRSYISKKDREITAYHEAGHAVVTKLLLPEHYISKVTIIPSVRGAGGFSLSIPKDTLYQTQKQIKSNIQVLLGGRVAEELIFGREDITTGASNDISKASNLIVDYINKFGMDEELGLFNVNAIEGLQDSQMVDKCRKSMNALYKETKKLLKDNQDFLEKVAEALLEKESINSEDIDRMVS